MTENNENVRNLLKINHLTDLGLELFSDTGKFGNDLKNSPLECLLLNGDSETYCVENDVRHDFDTFHDYVPHDMPSLLPTDQNTDSLEVFPVTDPVLLGTGSETIDRKVTTILNAVDSPSPLLSASGSEISLPTNDVPPRKKYKMRRTVKPPKFKKKVTPEKIESSDFSNLKDARLNGFRENYNDNTELDNRINDSLLDMLQAKTGVNRSQISLTDCNRPSFTELKNEKYSHKFITLFPSKPDGKIINLMVKGKCCRSKQPLTESELRMVTKMLNNEFVTADHSGDKTYRNVYYDAETDSNIRYEVKCESASEETAYNLNAGSNFSEKKPRFKSSNEGSNKEGYVLNSVARTRCGRISRPPRHVIQDYKRLNESNNDADNEKANNGGYADYRNEDTSSPNEMKNAEPVAPSTLYGPLEPLKRHFSSLSRCPTCDKIYLGYRRMAIHFQKYPEHKNDELLKHLLIRSKKKALEENNGLSNVSGDESSANPGEVPMTSVPVNANARKKGRLSRRFRMRGSKSYQLKELLSSFRREDIVNYAAPAVATILSSWEYLLLRARKMKNDRQTLAVTLFKEISVVMKRLRSLSHDLLRPCEGDKENSKNIFVIEEEDVLQHVLGLTPGRYIASDDENWVKENPETIINKRKQNLKDEYAALCSSTVNSDEDVSDPLQSSINQRDDMVNSFYHIVTQHVPTTVTVADLVHNIKSDSTAASVSVPLQPSVLTHNEHFAYEEDSSRLFGDVKGSIMSSVNMSVPSQLTSETGDSNLTVDYMAQSFSPSHSLNFDSLVDDDLMNAFPITLPMLSDNSSDSKDYKDILNSLKDIECTPEKSILPHIQDTISNNDTSESSSVNLLSTLKNVGSADKTITTSLRSTVANDSTVSDQTGVLDELKNIDEKPVVHDLGSTMSEHISGSGRIDLLSGLKGTNGRDNNLTIGEMRPSISTSLAETLESPCILDLHSSDPNF